MTTKKVAIILGTRPEIIKMSPLLRVLEKENAEYIMIHTGQHYSPNMDKVFFDALKLPSPKYKLDMAGKSYSEQMGEMIREIKKILQQEHIDVAIVQGDTNTVLAGALAAQGAGIKIAHHEAGLRSYDLSMPEERNRILTDHISDYLFTPTSQATEVLLKEGIPQEKIVYSGNTIVDAVLDHKELANEYEELLEEMGVTYGSYFLVTSHRAENVDDPKRLQGILDGLMLLKKSYPDTKILFSLHPRTKLRMEEFNIAQSEEIQFFEPVGFLEFLLLESNAKLIITDSGGIQEEASILQIPCVTVRDNTERPQTIEAGINILAGAEPTRIVSAVKELLSKELKWTMLFGDGTAGKKILEHLKAVE